MKLQKVKKLLIIIFKRFSNKNENAVQIYLSTQWILGKCWIIIFTVEYG